MIGRLFLVSVALVAYGPAAARPVAVSAWGATAHGHAAHLYTLTNDHGMSVSISDFGGLVVAIDVPDRQGKTADVALGFKTFADWQAHVADTDFGSPIGRYANRIAGARFPLDGRTVQMTPNEGANLLHSGPSGYNRRFWQVTTFDRGKTSGAVLHLVSPAGDQGFPGTLDLTMTYTLTEDNALHIDYRATTSAPTVVNLTNHSYFNLAGEGSGDIADQTIQIFADRIATLGASLVPTGEIAPVSGPYDLREPVVIGTGLAALKAQGSSGYDTPYVLADRERAQPVLAARATDPASGRVLEMLTTAPSVQFYTANGDLSRFTGPGGRPYGLHAGFALEAQHLADSPNHPNFPSTVLRLGETLTSTTIYRFSVLPR